MTDANTPKPLLSSKDLKPTPSVDLNKILEISQNVPTHNFKPQPIPKFERQAQEVKVVPEPKTRFEEFVEEHKGAFTFGGLIISVITLILVIISLYFTYLMLNAPQ